MASNVNKSRFSGSPYLPVSDGHGGAIGGIVWDTPADEQRYRIATGDIRRMAAAENDWQDYDWPVEVPRVQLTSEDLR